MKYRIMERRGRNRSYSFFYPQYKKFFFWNDFDAGPDWGYVSFGTIEEAREWIENEKNGVKQTNVNKIIYHEA